jgi:hypothetical protein
MERSSRRILTSCRRDTCRQEGEQSPGQGYFEVDNHDSGCNCTWQTDTFLPFVLKLGLLVRGPDGYIYIAIRSHYCRCGLRASPLPSDPAPGIQHETK